MSLLDKIFRRRDDSGFAAGVAFFEEGDYAQAVIKLREALGLLPGGETGGGDAADDAGQEAATE